MTHGMAENDADKPLETIRSKERQLALRLKDAEERAKEKLAAAQARAAAIRQAAETTGQREAEQFFLDEMTRAAEATALVAKEAGREAEQLTQRGERCLERAVQIAIDFILPK